MCDTLYCVPGQSGSSSKAFFGKNSDRHPAEPQSLCIVARRGASGTSMVGGRTLPLADAGYSFVLSKPTWMGGGEMGINEKGVAIGNEAVFSRFKPAKEGVLGMDMLRAALGAAGTAKEALDFLCRFVEAYDQGGNGAFKGSLYYNNSFIIADFSEAYILETAGRRWAWRAAGTREAISNAYSIEEDYKRLDVQTRKEIAPVNERAACSDEADPGRKGSKESFKTYMENRFYLRFTKGESRRKLSLALLEEFWRGAARAASPEPILAFQDILRSHGPFVPERPGSHHMESLCVHPGGLPATATTASFAVDYRGEDKAIIWFTGTSTPCLSLYKPLLLYKGEFTTLWNEYDYAEGSDGAEAYWKRWKAWMDRSRSHRRSLDSKAVASRTQAQEALVLIAEKALGDLEVSKDLSWLPVLRQEAGAVVSGWEKDLGL